MLETIFLYLTIIVPSLFLIIMILNIGKVIKKKKFRNKIIACLLVSLFINGLIFGGIKILNANRKDENEVKQPNIVDNFETENEQKQSNDIANKESNESKPNDDNPVKPNNNDLNKTSKGFSIETRDGVTYIDGYMIANKTYSLPEKYIPTNTYKSVTNPNGACAECIVKEAYEAYTKMRNTATENGLTLWIASGFRSYSYQAGLYNNYVKRSGKEQADTYSARPGNSEHQTGYAFDLNTVNDSFANTKEGRWVNENCYKFGFIIRYPKGKDNETGYKYEPWHLRYVGTELALKLYNSGDWITMEDYFGITSEYAN